MAAEEIVPDIGGELLQAERQALILGVDVEHHRVDDVALLQHLGRMLDPLAPRHVGDVDQAVDFLLDFDERTELGEVTNLALNSGPDGVFVGQVVPRIALDLLQAERDAARRRIDAKHHGFNVVADVQNLRRVLDALAPRHLGDVDQPLDARLELDERAVIGETDDFSFNARTNRIALHHVRPGIGDELLVAEGDALGRRVVLQHDDVDLVVHLEQLGRVADTPPRHIRDVKQTDAATQVDEGAVIGDVLHDALEDLAFSKRHERVLLLLGVLLFEEGFAREDDVAALLVDLNRAHAELLSAERIEVANRSDVDLRSGEERAHADINREAAFDS